MVPQTQYMFSPFSGCLRLGRIQAITDPVTLVDRSPCVKPQGRNVQSGKWARGWTRTTTEIRETPLSRK